MGSPMLDSPAASELKGCGLDFNAPERGEESRRCAERACGRENAGDAHDEPVRLCAPDEIRADAALRIERPPLRRIGRG